VTAEPPKHVEQRRVIVWTQGVANAAKRTYHPHVIHSQSVDNVGQQVIPLHWAPVIRR